MVRTAGTSKPWVLPPTSNGSRSLMYGRRKEVLNGTVLRAKIIEDPANDPGKNLRYFRAFDFHNDSSKQQVLQSLLTGNHPQQKMITVYALTQMDTAHLAMTPALQTAIKGSLEAVKGTP